MSRQRTRNFGLVVAAGQGRRFGGLKQFCRVKGLPLLAHSLLAFERCPSVSGVVLVTNRSRIPACRRLVSRLGLRRVRAVVAGGRRRADSVLNGLRLIPERALVAVHDSARPLVTPAMIEQGFRQCRRTGPVIYAAPVTETVKKTFRGRVSRTVDRAGLYTAQTPQFFPVSLLRRAYRSARTAGLRATDDCAVVERLGRKPRLLPGPRTNIKVTTPEDLDLVRNLL